MVLISQISVSIFEHMNIKRLPLLLLALSGIIVGCKNNDEKKESSVKTLTYAVKTQWKHDPQAFTQGLVIHEGKLFESTGQEGSSWVGIIDINTGTPDKKVVLDKKYFGEGITILNNKIYHLTWKTKIGFVYDLKTFEKVNEFTYDTEGWGITHDGKNLMMSDGSDKITFLDTTSLKPIRTISVTNDNGPVTNLNELEYVEGYIMANLWQTNLIVKIDPQTGKVVGQLDLTPLATDAQRRNPRVDVLNGIAYHPTTKLLLVTGKYWPMTYVIQLKGS
jgi:glutaminyl-peptide cyclotransferase